MGIQILSNLFRPNASADYYLVEDSLDIKGGWRVVADNTARDAILTSHRKIGMKVYSVGAATEYQLIGGTANANWQVSTSGGGGSGLGTSVRAVSTSNIASLSGTTTVDGVSLVAGNRVLLAGQSTASQNGIYVVASGAWSRSTDMAAGASVAGAMVIVQEGTANADTIWLCTTDAGSDVVGTNSLAFSSYGKYTAGTGISITSGSIAVSQIAESQVTNLVSDLAGKVPTTRTLTGGTGINTIGDLSVDRTISLANTAVTLGSYGSATQVATYTVDQQGRLTASANVSIQITESQVTNLVSDLAAKLSGTLNSGKVPYATGSTTLADSGLTWDNANTRLGIAQASPAEALDVTGSIRLTSFLKFSKEADHTIQILDSTAAATAGGNLSILAAAGTATSTATAAGAGGGFTLTAGAGGNAGASSGAAGAGGGCTFTLGAGGTATATGGVGGTGGSFSLTAGQGGTGVPSQNAGAGGNFTLTAGAAGAAGGGNGGNGGNFTINAGAKSGVGTNGTISIGTSNTSAVAIGTGVTTTHQFDAVGQARTSISISLKNTTASTSGTQGQWSPLLEFLGTVWDPTNTVSKTAGMSLSMNPVVNGASPLAELVVVGNINGAGYTSGNPAWKVRSDGVVTFYGTPIPSTSGGQSLGSSGNPWLNLSMTGTIQALSTSNPGDLSSSIADGASAIGWKLRATTLATAGSKIASFQASNEKSYVDKDGNYGFSINTSAHKIFCDDYTGNAPTLSILAPNSIGAGNKAGKLILAAGNHNSGTNADGGDFSIDAGTGATGGVNGVGVIGGNALSVTVKNLDPCLKRVTVADAAYSMTATDGLISYTSLTATRVITLPIANSVSAGKQVEIQDESGSASGSVKIQVARSGSDTINGSASNFDAVTSANGFAAFRSDGSSKWFKCG